jgi:hypothetical protein
MNTTPDEVGRKFRSVNSQYLNGMCTLKYKKSKYNEHFHLHLHMVSYSAFLNLEYIRLHKHLERLLAPHTLAVLLPILTALTLYTVISCCDMNPQLQGVSVLLPSVSSHW